MPKYRPIEFPDYETRPWSFPRTLWRVSWFPIRLYLHAGDRVLFWLWWQSRPFFYWLEDKAGTPYSTRYLLRSEDMDE